MDKSDFEEKYNKIFAGIEKITGADAPAYVDDHEAEETVGVDILYSPMERAKRTKDLALGDDPAIASQQSVELTREISLGAWVDLEKIPELVDAVNEGRPPKALEEAFGVAPPLDSPEHRKDLSNIEGCLDTSVVPGEVRDPLNPSKDHGETNFEYAQRGLVGLTAILLYASREGGVEKGRKRINVDKIADTIKEIPLPTKEQVAYIFQFQKHLKDPKNEACPPYDEALIYKPLADALACLPEGTRIILARHGNTPFSDAQYDYNGKKVGLLAGGNVDLPLTAKGEETALQVGAMIKDYLASNLSNNKVVMFGHSQLFSLFIAAMRASSRSADIQTDGTLKPDSPHVFKKTNGKLSENYVSSELAQAQNANRQATVQQASSPRKQTPSPKM